MAEDTIVVAVDDSQLEDILARLELVGMTSQKVTGKRGDLGQTLPSINRELRLILGQVPGMRILISDYFRLLRIQRSMLIARGELKKAGKEITLQGILLQPQMILTAIATLVLVVKWLTERQKNMERRQQEYETYIRRERDLTHDEYIELTKNWQSYFRSTP